MKITLDDKHTGVDVFNDGSHKHFFIYAGTKPNRMWAKIVIDRASIPNCISIDTFPTTETMADRIIIGIPENLLKLHLVEDRLQRFGKFSVAPRELTLDEKAETRETLVKILTNMGIPMDANISDLMTYVNSIKEQRL